MFGSKQLKKSSSFSRLSETDLALLLSRMEKREVKAGDIVCRQGEKDSFIRVLLEGELENTVEAANGNRISLGVISEANVFGLERFSEYEPRTSSIEATTDAMIYEMSVRTFRELYEQMPRAISTLLDEVTQEESGRISEIKRRLHVTSSSSDPTISRAIPPSRQKQGVNLDKEFAIAERYPETSEMLSVSLLEELQRKGKCVSYPIGTSFFHKGDTPENCAIILSGKIRISGTDQQASLQVTTESAGGILGVAALYPQKSGEATAYTVSEVHVIEFSRATFLELLQEPTADICRLQEIVLRKILAKQNATLRDIIEQEGQRPKSSDTVPLLRSEIEKRINILPQSSRPKTAETFEVTVAVSSDPVATENEASSAQTISVPTDDAAKPSS